MSRFRRRRSVVAAVVVTTVLATILATGLAVGLASDDRPADPVTDPSARFGRANDAFRDGRYETAIEGYEALIAAGLESAEIHFNLGDAQLAQGELGAAIASFLRARRMAPRDADIAANLALARADARDDVQPPDPGRAVSILIFWHYRWSPAETAWALVVANLTLWALLALGLGLRLRSDAWRATVAVVVAVVVALAASVAVRRLAPLEVAVVTAEEAEARSGFDDQAVTRFVLHEGTEVRLRDRRPGWLRVALPSGPEGWLPEDSARVVRP